MGCLGVCSLVAVILAALGGYVLYSLGAVPPVPEVKVGYWGPGSPSQAEPAVRPFKMAIPDEDVKLFTDKLRRSRKLVPPLEGIGFDYGVNSDYVNSFVEFWKTKYDWRQRERYLNSLPQFTTQIGGLRIHFLHAKPDPAAAKGKKVVPVVLLHGWPGSVLEFYELVPKLIAPRPSEDFVFEVVAPSLPGYGFSQGSAKPGLGVAQIAAIVDNLMDRLGHRRYFVQGGDWGSAIGQAMSVLFPKRVSGYHSNFCLATTPSARLRTLIAYIFPSLFMEEGKIKSFKSQFADTVLNEMGYYHFQATKPDTIGVALTDSPIGLATYLLEKFSTWTNRAHRSMADGGLAAFDKARLLDNIMLYWFSGSITTSMRLYSEVFHPDNYAMKLDRQTVAVPAGCAQFPNEILSFPRFVLEGSFADLVTFTEMPRGGHFAAFEQPQLLADDLWKFVGTVRRRN